jgi:hypothetical protein
VSVACPSCASEDLDLVEVLDDGRRRIRCGSCGNEWLRGEAVRVYRTPKTIADHRARFPTADAASGSARERAAALKARFLASHPEAGARSLEFRHRYAELFSEEGLAHTTPHDLKYFANANLGANPGNMSVFNNWWNRHDAEEAASRVRSAIEYLLYGPKGTYIEDCLTNLIDSRRSPAVTGFKEALLTKVLCMVEPDRFLPIVKYTGSAGKREIARWVYGIDLPEPEAVSWTIGRLMFWSNDLLMELVGDGFRDTQHVAEFLWRAKDDARVDAGDPTPAVDAGET